jgi:hypothetical protein
LDPEWAISEINQSLHVTDQVGYDNDPSSGVVFLGTVMRGSETDASQRASNGRDARPRRRGRTCVMSFKSSGDTLSRPGICSVR